MIPQGTGWQYLRAQALDTIPTGTKVYYTRAVPLHEWRKRGTFTVNVCDRNLISLETAGVEIAGALLSDAEFLLDHAAEHQTSFRSAVREPAWQSPGWAVVTAYYWAFFTAQAITRLAGRTVLFLDRAAITSLRQLAGSAQQPNGGPLDLALEPYVSVTTREVTFRRCRQKQLHDAMWASVHRLISAIFAQCDQAANPTEYRFWWCLKQSSDLLGTNWASSVRNTVNYRPGCGYREVIRKPDVDLPSFIRQYTPTTVNDLISRFENAVIAIRRPVDPSTDVRTFSRLLGFQCISLAAVADALHTEVLTRQNGDQRWRGLRTTFLVERCPSTPNRIWPFS